MHLVFSWQAKKNGNLLGFPLDLFGHSKSKIVHHAGPHPPRSCIREFVVVCALVVLLVVIVYGGCVEC